MTKAAVAIWEGNRPRKATSEEARGFPYNRRLSVELFDEYDRYIDPLTMKVVDE